MKLAGAALILVAFVDLLLAFVVVGPRVADEQKRRVIMIALGLSSLVLLALGGAMVAGALG